MAPNTDQSLERRRIQNRMAQRRYRRRQSQKSNVDLGLGGLEQNQASDHCMGNLTPASLHEPFNMYETISFSAGDDNPTSSYTDLLSYDIDLDAALLRLSIPEDKVDKNDENLITSPSTSTSATSTTSSWTSPLHLAAQNCNSNSSNSPIIHMLLAHGADPNEVDSRGLSPLSYAVILGYIDTARVLLSRGAGIVPEARGWSPVHLAVLCQRKALLHLLLEHRPALSPQLINECYDDAGMTPLHIAIQEDFEEGVRLLLLYGADPCSRTSQSVVDAESDDSNHEARRKGVRSLPDSRTSSK
ncbi:ankyrin repeat-containing domain protein [Xylaria digitata]|nr:ankyrin repeat-containing domain protein [Xylaria digitata]